MAKSKKREESTFEDLIGGGVMGDFNIDDTVEFGASQEVAIERPVVEEVAEETTRKVSGNTEPMVNCLKNERVIVRFIPKSYCSVTNPKHVLYGGMSEGSKRTFVVPSLRSGTLYNVLTNAEMAFLEAYMGLTKGALSVHKKTDNFWLYGTPGGIHSVTLNKSDNYFDLSDPMDYIRYKILLANKDFIASDLNTLEDKPKSTYQFVCILEQEEAKHEVKNMSNNMRAYMEYGKIEHDEDKIRYVVEVLDKKPISATTKIEFIKSRVNSIIQERAKDFIRIVTDPLLDTKLKIKKAVKRGIISVRGNYYYYSDGNVPLCGNKEEPTFNNAAAFLNLPSSYELLMSIETKLSL